MERDFTKQFTVRSKYYSQIGKQLQNEKRG